jgi:branched-chain amino acid transport system permease protein
MAVVLVVRPWGLMGKPQAAPRVMGEAELPIRPADRTALGVAAFVVLALQPACRLQRRRLCRGAGHRPAGGVLFAASLHFIMGPAGMHSFGHAAYFGLGAYGAALLVRKLGLPMEAALVVGPLAGALGALIVGWFCVRLSGVYLAMLTLAFAQIVWAMSISGMPSPAAATA